MVRLWEGGNSTLYSGSLDEVAQQIIRPLGNVLPEVASHLCLPAGVAFDTFEPRELAAPDGGL